jgi:hypothetical protein
MSVLMRRVVIKKCSKQPLSPMENSHAAPSKRANCDVFCLFSLISTARPVSAEVTWIEFTSKQPYGTFRAGDYVIWQGKIRGVR